MITNVRAKKQNERGFTLFVAVVTSSIVLAMGMSILNITLKEYMLSGIARDSEMAFAAADAGMECGSYFDEAKLPEGAKFALLNPSFSCMGAALSPLDPDGSVGNGNDVFTFQVGWGGSGGIPAVCTRVTVEKYDSVNDLGSGYLDRGDCPSGVVCTQIRSNGYNRACDALTGARTVERTLRSRY